MSFNSLFGGPSEQQQSNKNRPDRYSDLPERPAPAEPDLSPTEPWFVSPVEETNSNLKAKKIINRTVSILLPIVGIAILGLIIAQVILFVVGLYEQ